VLIVKCVWFKYKEYQEKQRKRAFHWIMFWISKNQKKTHNNDKSYMYFVIGSIFVVFVEASKRIVLFLWRDCTSLWIHKEM